MHGCGGRLFLLLDLFCINMYSLSWWPSNLCKSGGASWVPLECCPKYLDPISVSSKHSPDLICFDHIASPQLFWLCSYLNHPWMSAPYYIGIWAQDTKRRQVFLSGTSPPEVSGLQNRSPNIMGLLLLFGDWAIWLDTKSSVPFKQSYLSQHEGGVF